jgi:hypothetical protein
MRINWVETLEENLENLTSLMYFERITVVKLNLGPR